MNQFKFRAWYKSHLDKGIIEQFDQVEIDYELYFVSSKDKDIKYKFDIPFMDDDWIVEQYTGLKDKNGVEIYEGDRLSMTDEAGKNGIVTVGFEEGGFIVFKGLAWRYIGTYDKLKNNIEVVGNIHEGERK